MGLLKLFKKIFSKNKKEINTTDPELKKKQDYYIEKDNNLNENNNKSDNNLNINSNHKINQQNEKKTNIQYDQEKINAPRNNPLDNYLESEQLIKLKYLNTTKNKQQENINQVNIENINENQLNTIWDLLKIKENTQAEHIINSIPSDKWVTMDEIRHNIKLNYNVEYSNEKSLYPYLKTLTDINLIKLNNIGKKRSWKKNIIIIKK